MKFITLLFLISCTLFAKEQAYFLLGVSVDELERKTTISTVDENHLERTYSLNLTVGQEYDDYKYSFNLIANDHLLTFISLDYLHPSMLEGDTKSFIGISIGNGKFDKLVYNNTQNKESTSLLASIQAGFTSNDMEFGYRYFFIDEEYLDNTDKEKLKTLHSLYIAMKF